MAFPSLAIRMKIVEQQMPDSPAVGPALAFDGVGMVFPDGTHTLSDITFDIASGEFVAVVGPSGCGKSTLLRVAAGLETATTGSVGVDRSNIGFVFQDSTLLNWRTVTANIELIAELRGVSKGERSTRAATAIETVGLKGFENHYPPALSGGMRMRTSIARSLIMRPPVFLFDEPFGSLDEITREHLQSELMRLFLDNRFAGLLVTHSVSEAVYLASRVLVMSSRPGRIVAEIEIPFPYPRSPHLRFDPTFAEIAGAISAELRQAH